MKKMYRETFSLSLSIFLPYFLIINFYYCMTETCGWDVWWLKKSLFLKAVFKTYFFKFLSVFFTYTSLNYRAYLSQMVDSLKREVTFLSERKVKKIIIQKQQQQKCFLSLSHAQKRKENVFIFILPIWFSFFYLLTSQRRSIWLFMFNVRKFFKENNFGGFFLHSSFLHF